MLLQWNERPVIFHFATCTSNTKSPKTTVNRNKLGTDATSVAMDSPLATENYVPHHS
jgi:hypothetical protein